MIHLETVNDRYGTYEQIWECPPPPEGQRYRVLDESWTGDERIIRAIELVES